MKRRIEAIANPTRRTGGRRVPLDGQAAWRDWLARKGEAGGFQPRDVDVVDEGVVVGYRPLDRSRPGDGLVQAVRLRAVAFSGSLVVTDAARLAETLRGGVGSGKGFGFGLLLLDPAD